MSSSNERTRTPLRLRALPKPSSEISEPAALARELELWALRREKVLPLLAPRLARRARELAMRSQALADAGFTPSHGWGAPLQQRLEWLDIREQFIAIVLADSGGRSDIGEEEPPADAQAVTRDNWEVWS